MSIAYSYKRFSSKRQQQGRSLERQADSAEKYAALHNLTLDNTYHDLGVSAYKGKNVVDGALGAFLAEVETGRIAKGSFLLVENLDRLSRDKVRKALPIFLSIINADIKIVTLLDDPPQVYSAAKIDDDNGMSLFGSLMIMVRAHDESNKKGTRVKDAWDAKRASGLPMTKICPFWLKLSEDRLSYVVLHEKAKVVQRMFELSSNGTGIQSMSTTFNKTKVPVLGNAARWTASAIARVLHNKAVIGDLTSPRTGEVTEGYYPPIIEPDVFYRVQEAIKFRDKQGKGRKGAFVANLFSGMCKCGDCGGSVRYVTKKPNSYLQCLVAYSQDGKCKAPRLNYDVIEARVLFGLFNLESLPLLSERSGPDPLIALRGELQDKNARIERVMNEFEAEEDAIVRRHSSARIKKLGAEIAALEKQINAHVPAAPLGDVHLRAYELYKAHQALLETKTEELREVRLKLQSAMQPLIRRIVLRSPILKVEPDTYYRELVLYGPLVDLILKGEFAELYDTTEDGGLVFEYTLPDWGMMNTQRAAAYKRQAKSRER